MLILLGTGAKQPHSLTSYWINKSPQVQQKHPGLGIAFRAFGFCCLWRVSDANNVFPLTSNPWDLSPCRICRWSLLPPDWVLFCSMVMCKQHQNSILKLSCNSHTYLLCKSSVFSMTLLSHQMEIYSFVYREPQNDQCSTWYPRAGTMVLSATAESPWGSTACWPSSPGHVASTKTLCLQKQGKVDCHSRYFVFFGRKRATSLSKPLWLCSPESEWTWVKTIYCCAIWRPIDCLYPINLCLGTPSPASPPHWETRSSFI